MQDNTNAAPETTATPEVAAPAKKTTTRKRPTAKDKTNGRTPAKASPTKGKSAPAKSTAKTTKSAEKAETPKVERVATSAAPEGHPGHTWLKLMVEAGLSQTACANAMEVAPMTLNRLVNGKGIPTANVTIRFAGAVKKPVKPLWDEVSAWELKVAQDAVSKSA